MNAGGGGGSLGGGGRFSGGGGGGGLTSSMILVSMGPLTTSTTLRAKPLSSAQPENDVHHDDNADADHVFGRIALLFGVVHSLLLQSAARRVAQSLCHRSPPPCGSARRPPSQRGALYREKIGLLSGHHPNRAARGWRSCPCLNERPQGFDAYFRARPMEPMMTSKYRGRPDAVRSLVQPDRVHREPLHQRRDLRPRAGALLRQHLELRRPRQPGMRSPATTLPTRLRASR